MGRGVDCESDSARGLYLLYLGLPVLMKAPAEKALGYTAVVIIAAIVLFLIVGLETGTFMSVLA